MKRIIILVCTSLFATASFQSVQAQSFLLKSNDDLGKSLTLFCDNDYPEWYPFHILDEELIRVKYDCYLALEDSSKVIQAEYRLQIGKGYTKFVSMIRHRSDSLRSLGGHLGGKIYNEKANPLFVEDCYYVDKKKGVLTFTGRLAADDFLYEETLPSIKWRLIDAQKTICGYICRQAEGVFRGRTYLVWYTEQLPYSSGPWKFQGLPGVIMEVEDSEHLHHVQAVQVYQGNGDIIMTDYPYIKVSRKQYLLLLDQMISDPWMFLSNHTSRSAAIVRLGSAHTPSPFKRPIFLEKE